MGIQWGRDEEHFATMERIFLDFGKQALTWNHYDLSDKDKDLAGVPRFSPDLWKEFLVDQRVSNYINNEFEAIQSSELRKLIMDIGSSRSVGQAQLITALSKIVDNMDRPDEDTKLIYMYVPLNDQQVQAENVQLLDIDPFLRETDDADTPDLPT